MAKWNEKQLMIAVVGGGALLAALAGGGIWWAKGLVEEEQQAIEGLKQQIAQAEAQIAKIPSMESEVIILRENVDEYVKILPEDDYINNFIRRTEEFLRQSGVTISNLTPGNPVARGKFDQYSYRISLEGTLWEFMKFANQFESYERFVRIKEFTLTTGDGKRDAMTGGDVRHRVSMVVETFVYRGAKGSKSVNIANYATKRENLREKILANAMSIKLRRYEYKDSQGRRDIFVDPRQSATVANQGNPLEVQKARIAKFANDVQAAKDLFERIQDERLTYLERAKLEKSLRSHLDDLNSGIADVSDRELITWPPFKLKWNYEVLQPLEEIQRQITKSRVEGRDRFLTLAQLENLLGTLKQDMKDGKFEDVKERYNSVRPKLGVDREDERYVVVEEIEMLMLYVDAVTSFSALPLDIEGVVVQGDGRSGLLLNGSVMEEGDYVTDELVLSAVQPESAEFLYRGFVIVKSW